MVINANTLTDEDEYASSGKVKFKIYSDNIHDFVHEATATLTKTVKAISIDNYTLEKNYTYKLYVENVSSSALHVSAIVSAN